MEQCINFELSKKLYEKWFIGFKQCEYSRFFRVDDEWNSLAVCKNSYNEFLEEYKEYPTMTLEGTIEFLRKYFKNSIYDFSINLLTDWYSLEMKTPFRIFSWKTLLEAIEKMLKYLLDNNLLQKW